MKKVLVVAYHFPPMGGSGVQRTAKFVKHLRSFGYEPVVLTRDVRKVTLRDDSLLKDIPEDVTVMRTTPWDLAALPGILAYPGKFISRKVLIPDGERLWQLFSRKRAVEAIRQENIDLVYTTSSPYSDHLMGLHLKKVFPHIPWVADFRDEWINNPYLLDNPHYAARMKVERNMERQVLINADQLITNTPVMLKNFLESNSKLALNGKFHVIPNGYDKDDFNGITGAAPSNSKFTITYTGLLYGRRKPDIFFEAVASLVKDGSIDSGKVAIKLIGNYKQDQMNNLINRYGLQGIVNILPYMKHDDCIRELMASDVLLLIEGGGPGAEAFYTGKVFEYMVAGRPILAVVPVKGAAAELIRETRTGLISDCGDAPGTARNMLTLYRSWLEHRNDFHPDEQKIRKYERKELTRDLAEVFSLALKK